MIVDVREFSLFINVETNFHFLFDKSIFGFFSGRTAQISRRCKLSAAFALLGNDAIISICYSIVPHNKLFPSKVQ
jgi:hypothetical protein